MILALFSGGGCDSGGVCVTGESVSGVGVMEEEEEGDSGGGEDEEECGDGEMGGVEGPGRGEARGEGREVTVCEGEVRCDGA